jgi:hypothetical protein
MLFDPTPASDAKKRVEALLDECGEYRDDVDEWVKCGAKSEPKYCVPCPASALQVGVCVYTYVYVYICIYMYIYVYICIYMYVCVCVCVCICEVRVRCV